MATGAERIAKERQRQIEREDHTLEHDLGHASGELAWAAAVYAAPDSIFCLRVVEGRSDDGVRHGTMTWHEPWPIGWTQGSPTNHSPLADRIRDLERAGALIAAEIDRLLAGERA